MSRSGDMAILDALAGIIANKVYHFNERPVRDYSEQNGYECGKMEVDWFKKTPMCRVLSDKMLTKYVDLSEENPLAHLKHVFIDDVDSDSLLINLLILFLFYHIRKIILYKYGKIICIHKYKC